MSERFFERPILNSPYECPTQHWELDEEGQPTHRIVDKRRPAEFVTPIPKPKRRKGLPDQRSMPLDQGHGLSTEQQQYNDPATINEVRGEVAKWRLILDSSKWRVTPETQRLLQHWRNHNFTGIRPFFCQLEAVEVAIWLTEVAPTLGKNGKRFLDYLENANAEANPGLSRLALKLATGTGKTTVMAMLIAWQTINAVRHPTRTKFTRGFLIITPGLTIKDRLRVLQPNDPDSYYKNREIVPNALLPDLERAKIVITNYHAFKLRERIEISPGGRALLKGKRGKELDTLETKGQMIQRVMPELMSMKNIMAINDEAHHCYQEKLREPYEEDLKDDDKREADQNRETARLWINGLKTVSEQLGIENVIDLSATPFFLSGSGYVEGTLFPWTVSDFSLMDAIECGIVKLPRVPVADNIPNADVPKFRELWKHIGSAMPQKGRGKNGNLDPLKIPVELETALEALYGHYEKTSESWKKAGLKIPPCFIVVCNNTATSKLIYDYISGFYREHEDGSSELENGRLKLFRNFNEHGNPLAKPNTILIDSKQLESGDALDDKFREIASDEIQRFKREIVERTGDPTQAENISDQDLLREVMNTVGKPDTLGSNIRCVVSVSMLTEGWDANTVTHILGVRAFGTQLLCEQVIGRALRRQSYALNDEGLFNVEYADVLGIPFDFTAKPNISRPPPPRETIQVKAIRPERDELEIQFPRVTGYHPEFPDEKLTAEFIPDHVLELTPEIVGPSVTRSTGIIGEGVDLDLVHTGKLRNSTLILHLTKRLLYSKLRDPDKKPKLYLFGELKRITRQWLDNCLVCKGGTYPAQLMYQQLADMACSRIAAAIIEPQKDKGWSIKALLDPYNPNGSTSDVNFNTSITDRWETNPLKCHINWVILEGSWEAEFCRIVEKHPNVRAYVKNHSLGLEIPYTYGSESRIYRPDFIVQLHNDSEEIVNLIVEIKGYRREDAKEKKITMDAYWVPGVNNLGIFGRWRFAEFTDIFQMHQDFRERVEEEFNKAVSNAIDAAVPNGD